MRAADTAVTDAFREPALTRPRHMPASGLESSLTHLYVTLYHGHLAGRPIGARAVQQAAPDAYPKPRNERVFHRVVPPGDGNPPDRRNMPDCDIECVPALERRALAAIYAAGVYEAGVGKRKPIGVLAVFFDWRKQAAGVLANMRLAPEPGRAVQLRRSSMPANASSPAPTVKGMLTDRFETRTHEGEANGVLRRQRNLVRLRAHTGGTKRTPASWHGVVVEKPA